MRTLLTLTSLLLSTALLLVGQGMQLTLLPLRASSIGLSDFLIGVSASAYFLGFVAGCLLIPRIIAKVGHIRSFAVLTAIMMSAILALETLDGWLPWLLLRFLTGAMICGLYTVIESWLNDQTSAESRGQVLAIYTFIILAAMALGQILINVGPADSATPFILAAIFMALAIVPVGLTSRLAPAPIESTRIRFNLLYRRSRAAFAGTLLSGLVVGSFWALGAVFARRYGDSMADRIDRRYVLVFLSLGAIAASAAVALTVQHSAHLAAVFVFGAMTMPLYAISLATAADNSSAEEFVEIGTSVLLLNALGAASAPILLGQLMSLYDATALFWSFGALCAVFTVYLAIQTRDKDQVVAAEDQVPFSAAATEAAPTGFSLDPRGPEDAIGDLLPTDTQGHDEFQTEPEADAEQQSR